MSQGPIPVFGQYTGGNKGTYNVTAAGILKKDAANKALPGVLKRIVIQVVGSGGVLTLNDTDLVGNAAVGNQIFTAPTANLTVGQVIFLDWPCATGIVASVVSGGIIFSHTTV